MFRMLLETQWKWTRAVVLIATVIGFALPVASLQAAQDSWSAEAFVWSMQRWGPFYALLAAVTGLLVAISAWANDHRGRHVYALSLPVSRPRYALMRLAAGALFIIPPAVAVLLSASLVAQFAPIPAGLHAYPVALTLRFVFAALVAYALFFAIASATQKTAGVILGAVALLFLAEYLLSLANVNFDVLSRAAELIFSSPGVLSVFTGRWTLIDV
jgi:hypothetical protein